MGQWFGGVEQRLAGPDDADVVQSQNRMLEQVAGLVVDLKRAVLVQVFDVEPLHTSDRNTSAHERTRNVPAALRRRLGVEGESAAFLADVVNGELVWSSPMSLRERSVIGWRVKRRCG